MMKTRKNPDEILRKFLDSDYLEQFRRRLDKVGEELALRRKDTMVSIRLNHVTVERLKKKARRYGVGYQTFISEILRELVK